VVWECLGHAPGELIAKAKAVTFPAKRAAGHHGMMRYVRLEGLDKQINAELPGRQMGLR